MLKCPSDLPQYCNVEYKVDVFSKKIFISISRISLTPLQLNYLAWGPDVMVDMRSAAITHYNDMREEKEPAFVDEEKI